MTFQKISPDDPRLTTYALGQMEGDEKTAFELQLRHDPEALEQVEAIRSFGSVLEEEFKREGTAAEASAEKAANSDNVYVYPTEAKRRWVGRVYWLGGLAAAASVALLIGIDKGLVSDGPTLVAQGEVDRKEKLSRQELARLKEVANNEKAYMDAVASWKPPGERKAQDHYSSPVGQPETKSRQVQMPMVELRGDAVGEAEPAEGDANLEAAAMEPSALAMSLPPPTVGSESAAPGVSRAIGQVQTYGAGLVKKEMADGYGVNRPAAAAMQAPALLDEQKRQRVAADGIQPVTTPKLDVSNEGYARLIESGYSAVSANPLSTFSIDVDTASYANVRRYLNAGALPPREAVRVEELLNYFPYAYAAPKASEAAPVAATLEIAACPWNPAHRLARVGLKAREIAAEDRPAANLVLLLDTSGSMSDANKLPLVKQAMRLVAERLRPQDHLAIVTYAGSSGMALPSTSGSKRSEIYEALEQLQPGGSTYGSMGIQLAYDIAKANFVKGGVNRVILCTDGDFNVGVTSQTELQSLIEAKAKSGVFLTVLGFGMGNLKDSTLELLADKGNGNYGYVDSASEARKLLVEQAGGTLVTVAKDVKVQVEFNPRLVQAYRLVGYENRRLAAEDFNNDKIDAGEMGSGHTVTALYEIVPGTSEEGVPAVDALKYSAVAKATGGSQETLTVKVRYKAPDGDKSEKIEFTLTDRGTGFEQATGDFKFAASVAAFGQLLSGSAHSGQATLSKVQVWLEDGEAQGVSPLRQEFASLVAKAKQLETAKAQ